jgi:hypothetical protein
VELSKVEVAQVEEVIAELAELNDLQLALVGGGIGDVIVG